MEPQEDQPSITCLPDEIVVMILRNNNYRDIVRFGMTCKNYYEIVKNNQLLWKNVYKQTIPQMIDLIQLYGGSNWYKEVKAYYYAKKMILKRLIEMSTLYYERVNAIKLYDIAMWFNAYAIRGPSYYYTLCILQDMIRHTEKLLNTSTPQCAPPYTLTQMHYARTALRFYFHAFLAIQWSIWSAQINKPTPLQVVTFFVQWVWNEDLESQEIADRKIAELAEKVEELLKQDKGFKPSDGNIGRHRPAAAACAPEQLRTLAAITHVIYTQRHIISATDTANYDTLDVAKVLDNHCGHHIVVLAIYQALAAKFGLACELNVFPNHLFLEWSPNWDDPKSTTYIVDITTGTLKPKGRCPFARAGPPARFRYSPDSLIECLYMAFHRTMGYIQNWHTKNAGCLTELLKMDGEDDNAYRKMLPALYKEYQRSTLAIRIPLVLKYISTIHLDLISTLFRLEEYVQPLFKKPEQHPHPSRVKYAVGMICTHTKTDYKCVIKGWEMAHRPPGTAQERQHLQSGRMEFHELIGGYPYYYVLAVDQSTRHVPQDLLVDVKQPTRLQHLEEHLATEFSHFDGFRYVPNECKQREYPDDNAIALLYKNNSRAAL